MKEIQIYQNSMFWMIRFRYDRQIQDIEIRYTAFAQ